MMKRIGPNRIVLWIAVFGVCVSSFPFANAGSEGVPQERFERFHKGINIPSWLWLNRDEVQDLERRYTGDDFRLMKQLGFTHVRVPIDMEHVFDENAENLLNARAIGIMDRGFEKILGFQLAIIVDLHSISQRTGGSNYSGALGTDEKVTNDFIRFWGSFAKHLSTTDPDWVILGPMNEPVFMEMEEKWAPIQEKVVTVIRESAPKHTILATNVHWSSRDALMDLEPLEDTNIIYNFHYYEPHIFTHQGASWSSDWVQPLREIPYPSTPENVNAAIEQSEDERTQRRIANYGEERWNGEKVDGQIRAIAEWAKERNLKLFCDEFGVYARYSKPEDRAAWLRDVIGSFEKYCIGWAMWTYDGSFGVVNKRGGTAVVDKPIAEAMGLNVE